MDSVLPVNVVEWCAVTRETLASSDTDALNAQPGDVNHIDQARAAIRDIIDEFGGVLDRDTARLFRVALMLGYQCNDGQILVALAALA